jgi:type I restriction enzyme S subunit
MNWNTSTLGKVCEMIKRGVGPKYIEEDGICVINQKCIRNHAINYNLSRRHDLNAKKVQSERYIKVGDVLVNSTGTGTLGRVSQVRSAPNEPTIVDTHVTIVRPKKDIFHYDFFGYMLIKIEEEIANSGEGTSGQTELARTKLENEFSVSYPDSIPEQKRIVAILDKAFAAIDKAKAKTEQNLKNTRELFESYLQQIFSQRGEGWVESTLGETCSFQGGSQPPKSVFSLEEKEGYIRLIQIRDYKSDKNIVYIPIEKAKRFCSSDDVMIGRYGPPLFQILRGIEGAYNVALMKAVPNENVISKDFLFYFLKNKDILNYIIGASSRAAGQIGLNKATLEPYPINYPSLNKQTELVSKIKELISQVDGLENNYNNKLKSLDDLKKSILQKAFSGELTNKEVEEVIV